MINKRKIELASGATIEGPTDTIDFIEKRDQFIRNYCEERGWSPDDLSIEQIIEIREQDGWKRPR